MSSLQIQQLARHFLEDTVYASGSNEGPRDPQEGDLRGINGTLKFIHDHDLEKEFREEVYRQLQKDLLVENRFSLSPSRWLKQFQRFDLSHSKGFLGSRQFTPEHIIDEILESELSGAELKRAQDFYHSGRNRHRGHFLEYALESVTPDLSDRSSQAIAAGALGAALIPGGAIVLLWGTGFFFGFKLSRNAHEYQRAESKSALKEAAGHSLGLGVDGIASLFVLKGSLGSLSSKSSPKIPELRVLPGGKPSSWAAPASFPKSTLSPGAPFTPALPAVDFSQRLALAENLQSLPLLPAVSQKPFLQSVPLSAVPPQPTWGALLFLGLFAKNFPFTLESFSSASSSSSRVSPAKMSSAGDANIRERFSLLHLEELKTLLCGVEAGKAFPQIIDTRDPRFDEASVQGTFDVVVPVQVGTGTVYVSLVQKIPHPYAEGTTPDTKPRELDDDAFRDNVKKAIARGLLNPDQPLIAFCRTGSRTGLETLKGIEFVEKELGIRFPQVRSFAGGFYDGVLLRAPQILGDAALKNAIRIEKIGEAFWTYKPDSLKLAGPSLEQLIQNQAGLPKPISLSEFIQTYGRRLP